MTQTDKMLSRKEGGVGIVTFNNPERHNAVSLEMWEATKADSRRLRRRQRDPRRGADRRRRQGVRLGRRHLEVRQRARDDRGGARLQRHNPTRPIPAIAEFPKPTIAMIRGYCIGGGLGLAVVLRPAHLLRQFAVRGAGGEARPRLRLYRAQAARRHRRAVLRQGDFLHRAPVRRRRRRTPWAWSIAWCRRPSSKATSRSITDMICANAPLTIKAVKFTVGEILKDETKRDVARVDRDGRSLLRQPRLHRRPHRVHGKAQAGVHRIVTATDGVAAIACHVGFRHSSADSTFVIVALLAAVASLARQATNPSGRTMTAPDGERP